MARKRAGKRKVETKEPLVNPFTARHGDYREATVVDLGNELGGGRQKTYRVVRNQYTSIVDRWLAEGGPGFEDPQRRAIDHCRELWHRCGGQGALVANLMGTGGGNAGRENGIEQAEAFTLLGQYESRIPRPYWVVFERTVREGEGAGMAGRDFPARPADRISHVRSTVGFVASMIAQWRGY